MFMYWRKPKVIYSWIANLLETTLSKVCWGVEPFQSCYTAPNFPKPVAEFLAPFLGFLHSTVAAEQEYMYRSKTDQKFNKKIDIQKQ